MPENTRLLQEYSTCNKKALLQKIKRLVKSSALGKTVALNNTGLPETTNFLLYRFVQVRGCTAVQNSGTSDSTSTSGAGTVHCTLGRVENSKNEN